MGDDPWSPIYVSGKNPNCLLEVSVFGQSLSGAGLYYRMVNKGQALNGGSYLSLT